MRWGITLGAIGVVAAAALIGSGAVGATADSYTETVAVGLNNPRGLEFASTGDLYVAEAGTGAEDPDTALCVPSPEAGEACLGATSSVARVNVATGAVARVVSGLPSLAAPDGTGASGAADVAVAGRQLVYVTMGLGAPPEARDELAAVDPSVALLGTLGRVAGRSGFNPVADLAAFEGSDPDGQGADSNPFGAVVRNGKVLVTDAGGNSLVSVQGGTVSLVATFDSRDNPLPFGPPTYQSVPTSVTIGPDGAAYVGELTGFPFPVGAARIHRVAPNGAVSTFTDGFTNVIGVAADSQALYVAEMASESLLNGPIGAVYRVPFAEPDNHELLAGGLFALGGVAVSPDGQVYVTAGSILPGGGTVERIVQD